MKIEPGVFLIAMPTLQDPSFMRTVIYLLEHSDGGSLGLIVNRPVPVQLSDIWEECPNSMKDEKLCAEGGPVDRHKGLLIHRMDEVSDSLDLGLGLSVGGDASELAEAYASAKINLGPRLFLGHAGWTNEQLEQEVSQGSWLVRSGMQEILLNHNPPEDLWHNLISAGEELPQPSWN
ncbi:MAG: YqgE/AlgH family protein [Planctomycetes bacterium]|nr:YqgE/AlgH family protein [Planctomycetota bacterium]